MKTSKPSGKDITEYYDVDLQGCIVLNQTKLQQEQFTERSRIIHNILLGEGIPNSAPQSEGEPSATSQYNSNIIELCYVDPSFVSTPYSDDVSQETLHVAAAMTYDSGPLVTPVDLEAILSWCAEHGDEVSIKPKLELVRNDAEEMAKLEAVIEQQLQIDELAILESELVSNTDDKTGLPLSKWQRFKKKVVTVRKMLKWMRYKE